LRCAWPGCRGETWLSDSEREVYAHLQNAQRRETWLFGRLLSKELILDMLAAAGGPGWAVDPVHVEVLSRDGLGRPTRPRVLLKGRLQHWSLSLAHSDQSVLVGLSRLDGVAIGVDVTAPQPSRAGFLDLWFTLRERAWIRAQSGQASRETATLWAVKEAFYKAVNVGEGFAPQRIEVGANPQGGYAVQWLDSRPTGRHRVRVTAGRTEIAAVVTAAV
jgi:phosphopantetheinyl transferase